MSQGGEILSGLLDRQDVKADLSAFLHCLMEHFGGPAGLAKLIREDFDELPAGAPGRIKIETTIIDLMKGHVPDDENFDDAELDALECKLKSGANGDDADVL